MDCLILFQVKISIYAPHPYMYSDIYYIGNFSFIVAYKAINHETTLSVLLNSKIND